jgi:hypothetical protein
VAIVTQIFWLAFDYRADYRRKATFETKYQPFTGKLK